MASGLGASQITFTPNTPARSGDVNANFTALNQAAFYQFNTCAIDPALTPDSTFRGLKMITATEFGLLNNTSANHLKLSTGMTSSSKLAITDLSGNIIFGFWDDGTYDYLDCYHADFRLRTGASGTPQNTMRITSGNPWTIASTNYGFIVAANSIFNQGTGSADVAECLLTEGNILPGMAVCCIKNDTVAPCTHEQCRVAKIVSTNPTILLTARVNDDDDFSPITGHESARPMVVGGIVPVRMVNPRGVHLRDRVTTAGPAHPGLLRVADDHEYALGDVVRIEDNTIFVWIHY